MPALASPPPVVPKVSPSSRETDLSSVSFVGRSLTEYVQFFALDIGALRGRDVLDVAAGPSSFTAEACARKIHAVAVDPLYGSPHAELATRVRSDVEREFAGMRMKPRSFRFKSYATIDVAEVERRAAGERFLADYEAHFIHNRYVGGSLPRLPFFDGTFDVVLCAHLLFTPASHFDFDWRLAAARELVRVSADEVRIHPLGGMEGRPFPGLLRFRRELRESGIASEVRAVAGEFVGGADSVLILRRSSA